MGVSPRPGLPNVIPLKKRKEKEEGEEKKGRERERGRRGEGGRRGEREGKL